VRSSILMGEQRVPLEIADGPHVEPIGVRVRLGAALRRAVSPPPTRKRPREVDHQRREGVRLRNRKATEETTCRTIRSWIGSFSLS